jgi:hypothetical protein
MGPVTDFEASGRCSMKGQSLHSPGCDLFGITEVVAATAATSIPVFCVVHLMGK